MSVTIKDIAEHTGLAISTISKYINGGNVLPENQVKIKDAIDKLNFSVNPFARSMKTNKSYIIGVVISTPNDTYINDLLTLIQKRFMSHGYYCLTITSEKNEESQKIATEYMLKKNIDGIMFFDMFVHMNDFTQFKEKPIPVLSIGVKPKNEMCDQIRFDDFLAIDTVTSYYLSNNKKIGYIGGEKENYEQIKRYDGFLSAYQKYKKDVDDDLISFGNCDGDSGYLRMKELLSSEKCPDAIIVADSNLSVGASFAVLEFYKKDFSLLSVATFEVGLLPNVLEKKLDLLSLPITRLCSMATKILLEKIETNQDIIESIQIPYQLIITE